MTAGMPAGTAVAATGGVAAGAFRFNHGNNNQSYDRNKDYTYDYCSHKKLLVGKHSLPLCHSFDEPKTTLSARFLTVLRF